MKIIKADFVCRTATKGPQKPLDCLEHRNFLVLTQRLDRLLDPTIVFVLNSNQDFECMQVP